MLGAGQPNRRIALGAQTSVAWEEWELPERDQKRNGGLAVVVVTYNSVADIPACVSSVLEQVEVDELVVVDNASRDGTAGWLLERSAGEDRLKVLLNDRNRGFSAACNRGAGMVRAGVLLFLNPDSVLLPKSANCLLDAFENDPKTGIFGLKVFDWDGVTVQLSCRAFPSHGTVFFHRYSLLTRLFPGNPWSRRYLSTAFTHKTAERFDWVSGCAMGVRRNVFQELGGFDEDYFLFSEDVDLCKRAWQHGFEVRYLPSARVRHRIGGSSLSAPAKVIIERHRSMWLYYRKHLRGSLFLDAGTWLGIYARCALVLLRSLFSRRSGP